MTAKFITLQISLLTIAAVVTGSLAYYFLVQDNFLHISISAIIQHGRELAVKEHLLVVGLLPIYIAAIVFGMAMLFVYLGETAQHLFFRKRISK